MRTVLSALAATLAMTTPFALDLAQADGHAEHADSSRIGLEVGQSVSGDATLLTASGEEIALSDLWASGPVVLTFYRGGWCPYCNNALTEWEGKLGELESAGGELVALSPEKPESAGKTAEKNEASFKVLSDATFAAADLFNLRFSLGADIQKLYKGYGIDLEKANASKTWELPHPGTFVIDTDGTVRYAWVQEDYRTRANPDEVIAAVRQVTGNP